MISFRLEIDGDLDGRTTDIKGPKKTYNILAFLGIITIRQYQYALVVTKSNPYQITKIGKIHEIKEVEMIPFEDYSKIYPDVSNYVQGVKQLLEKKGFLYSQDYNISKRLQKTNDVINDVFNPFLFNSKILTKVMFPYCGYLIKGSIEHKVL